MSELRELIELREEAAGLAREDARAAFRDAAGLPAESRLHERLRAHPLAASRDGLAQAVELLREAQTSAKDKPGRISRLSGLRDLLVRTRAKALEPGAWQELRDAELRASVELHGDAGLHGMQSIRAIDRQLGRGRERGERADMEAALSAAEAQIDPVRGSSWEASESALGELEMGEPVDAAASLHARGWAPPEEKIDRAQTASERWASEKAAAERAAAEKIAHKNSPARTLAEEREASQRALLANDFAAAGLRPRGAAEREKDRARESAGDEIQRLRIAGARGEDRLRAGWMRTDRAADAEESRREIAPVETHARSSGAEQIAADCEKLLARTDALARDLGGWLLERHTGARPFPGDAERHDLLHLIRAPRCSPAFPRGEMLRTCRRWAEGFRFDLQAGTAIKFDGDTAIDEARSLAREGALAAPIDPPDEVRIHLFAEEGPWALAQLLSALGAAQLYAGPGGDAPPEDLLCHDPALPVASGAIFSGLIRDDSFRRRCAKAELPVDDGRAVAVAHLLELRIAAARTLASLEGLRSGLSARTAQLHRDLFARAGLAALPGGLGFRDLDPFLGSWAQLRGLAFAARTRSYLRERFDEDWWRNPRAQGPLRSLWTRGGRPNLRELWRELAPEEEPSMNPLLAELAEACG